MAGRRCRWRVTGCVTKQEREAGGWGKGGRAESGRAAPLFNTALISCTTVARILYVVVAITLLVYGAWFLVGGTSGRDGHHLIYRYPVTHNQSLQDHPKMQVNRMKKRDCFPTFRNIMKVIWIAWGGV